MQEQYIIISNNNLDKIEKKLSMELNTITLYIKNSVYFTLEFPIEINIIMEVSEKLNGNRP